MGRAWASPLWWTTKPKTHSPHLAGRATTIPAGKTVIFELAMMRLMMQRPERNSRGKVTICHCAAAAPRLVPGFPAARGAAPTAAPSAPTARLLDNQVVYVGTMKALCDEKEADWTQKFGRLGEKLLGCAPIAWPLCAQAESKPPARTASPRPQPYLRSRESASKERHLRCACAHSEQPQRVISVARSCITRRTRRARPAPTTRQS